MQYRSCPPCDSVVIVGAERGGFKVGRSGANRGGGVKGVS